MPPISTMCSWMPGSSTDSSGELKLFLAWVSAMAQRLAFSAWKEA